MVVLDAADEVIEVAAIAILRDAAEAASRKPLWDGGLFALANTPRRDVSKPYRRTLRTVPFHLTPSACSLTTQATQGYGGLARICDDDTLREQGVIRAVVRRNLPSTPNPPSPPPHSQVATPLRANDVMPPQATVQELSIAQPTSSEGTAVASYDRAAAAFAAATAAACTAARAAAAAKAAAAAAAAASGLATIARQRGPPEETQPPESWSTAPLTREAAPASKHRRVPSWVQEYVIGTDGTDHIGRDDDTGFAPSGGAPERPAGQRLGGGATRPDGRRLTPQHAPDPGLAWIAQLPTPPKNKPTSK